MQTRRALFASLLARIPECHCICGLDGKVLEQPSLCAPQPPGSTVKPLLAGLLQPGWRFACQRTLRIQGRRLDCAHAPLQGTLDLETALAASCNSWFAQAAQRLDGVSVQRTIQTWGGRADVVRTKEELVLAVLGLEQVWFTPVALARAYARLRREAPQAVRRGLEAAISYGTAAQASGSGLVQAGKTGTVREGAWFAGWTDRAVIALFVPGGTGGADAAPAAREILRKWHAGSSA